MTDYIVKCRNKDCGIIFKTDNPKIAYCSENCKQDNLQKRVRLKQIKLSIEKYKDIPDIPTCKLCGFKSTSLIQHLSETHNITQKTYMRKHKAKLKDIYHHTYTEDVKTRGKGFMTTCKICKTEFEKITPRRSLCSDECRKENNRRRQKSMEKKGTKLKCRQCNTAFIAKSHSSLYCSTQCRNRWYYEQKRKDEVKQCAHCKKSMSIHTYGKYCSTKCKSIVNRKRTLLKQIAINNERFKDMPDVPTCKICGFKALTIFKHIKIHHNLSTDQYCAKFNVGDDAIRHPDISKKIRRKVKLKFDKTIQKHIERTNALRADKYRNDYLDKTTQG